MDTNISNFSYTGELSDETGLIYLRARYYSPKYKQFISKDTYKGTTDDVLSQNQYTYTNNNPIKYIDPSGHTTVGLGYINSTITSGISPSNNILNNLIRKVTESATISTLDGPIPIADFYAVASLLISIPDIVNGTGYNS